MLRDLISREQEDLRQAWKRLLTEHCDRFIDQTVAELKRQVESSAVDEFRIQREYKRVESELRDRTNDRRKLLDAYMQARRVARDNIRALGVAIETELALPTAAKDA
jgi:hypothetical protein